MDDEGQGPSDIRDPSDNPPQETDAADALRHLLGNRCHILPCDLAHLVTSF